MLQGIAKKGDHEDQGGQYIFFGGKGLPDKKKS